MKRAKGTEHDVRHKSPGVARARRAAGAGTGQRDPAPLSARTLDYEGRIADLQQKIRELDDSRAALSSQLRALATKEELIEHIHHGWVEIFDAIVDPIFMHDRHGRVVRANRAYADMAGMDIRQVIGRPYWQVFPLHDGPLSSCALILSEKRDTAEEDLTLETGQTYRCRFFTLRDPAGGYLASLHIMTDVTERRHMEKSLKQERDFTATVMDTLGALVVVLDHEGRIVRFNRACEIVTGYSFADVQDRPVWDILLLPEELESVRTVFNNLRSGMFPNEHENYWRTRDGGRRLIRWSNTALTGEGGTVQYVLATGIDVTEQRAMEQALRDSEARFRTMIENSSDITALLDCDGGVRYTSPSIGRVLGYGDDELVGRNIFALVHPDDLPQVKGALARAVENPGVAQHVEHRFKDKDGVWHYLESVGKFSPDDCPVSGVVVNARDITARKQTDERLRHSEERFRNLVETTSDMVWEVDENAQYTYVSPQVRDLLGYEPGELLGRTPFDLMPPEEAQRVKGLFSPLAAERLPFTNLENTNLHKNGRLVVLESGGVPFFDETGAFRGYRGIDRDITARRLAEDKMREADASLRKLNRALKTLSACNESLVHAMNEQELLTAICQVIVRTGGYRFAWVGYAEHDEGKTVRPMAFAGEEAGFLDSLRFSWADDEFGRNPIGEAVRTGTRQGIHNIEKTSAALPPREEALRRGFYSCTALPLIDGDRVMGVLSIYASEADAFDEGEVKLLMELADDLTYGIVALRNQAEREYAMEENRQHAARIQKALLETVEAIGSALEKRDPYTAGHQRQVAKLAHAIAQEMHMPQEAVEGIYMGSLIHDVGKIYVPAEILSRPGKLSEAEFNLIKAHPQVGYEIIKGIEFPWHVGKMILQHHERLNGSGYPQGLKGDEICLEARILAVADVVEAMASHRPYRPSLGLDKGLEEISQNRGILYDPQVVDICLGLFREKGFALE